MEIQYQSTRADIKAFYEELWQNQKVSQHREYYYQVFWYLAVLGLAGYIALKHDEVFALCVFSVLAALYIKRNWSFAHQWDAQVEQYAEMIPESLCTLLLDESGVTERFSEVELRVPWSEIHDYTLHEERLFVHFLKYRSFIVPLRHLANSQHDELVKMLEQHKVHKRA